MIRDGDGHDADDVDVVPFKSNESNPDFVLKDTYDIEPSSSIRSKLLTLC